MQKSDEEIKQSIIDDPRPVSEMIDDIMHNVNSFDHRAYFDNGHIEHQNSVKKMELLHLCREGGIKVIQETMPVITKTASNQNQGEL